MHVQRLRSLRAQNSPHSEFRHAFLLSSLGKFSTCFSRARPHSHVDFSSLSENNGVARIDLCYRSLLAQKGDLNLNPNNRMVHSLNMSVVLNELFRCMEIFKKSAEYYHIYVKL